MGWRQLPFFPFFLRVGTVRQRDRQQWMLFTTVYFPIEFGEGTIVISYRLLCLIEFESEVKGVVDILGLLLRKTYCKGKRTGKEMKYYSRADQIRADLTAKGIGLVDGCEK